MVRGLIGGLIGGTGGGGSGFLALTLPLIVPAIGCGGVGLTTGGIGFGFGGLTGGSKPPAPPPPGIVGIFTLGVGVGLVGGLNGMCGCGMKPLGPNPARGATPLGTVLQLSGDPGRAGIEGGGFTGAEGATGAATGAPPPPPPPGAT